MKRAAWWRGALALLIGALVGPYWALLLDWNWAWSDPSHLAGLRLAVSTSTLAVTLPVIASALLNSAVLRHATTLVCVLGIALLLIGFVSLNRLDPAIWQGYTSDAEFISLLAIILVTPAAAAFTVGAMPPLPDARPAFEPLAILYALLAWIGIGVQNLALSYLVPFAGGVWYFVARPNLPSHASGSISNPIIIVAVALIATVIWVMGFGVAAIGGTVVAALLGQLHRENLWLQGSREPS